MENIFDARGSIRYVLLIPIVIFTMICSPAVQTAEGISTTDYEMPVYDILLPESTQRYIGKLCEENRLSYELVLAIYQLEGAKDIKMNGIAAEIDKLVYIRNYWTEQGFPDEIVFDLMLLSRQRGIEGCRIFMKNSDVYYLDNYVQKVTQLKYYIEQSLDEPLSVIKKSNPCLKKG